MRKTIISISENYIWAIEFVIENGQKHKNETQLYLINNIYDNSLCYRIRNLYMHYDI